MPDHLKSLKGWSINPQTSSVSHGNGLPQATNRGIMQGSTLLILYTHCDVLAVRINLLFIFL